MPEIKLARAGEPAELQWTARSLYDFDTTIARLVSAIEAAGLWLVSAIDPQLLLARAGYGIPKARQLLFFHPDYMVRLMSADARAVQEAPLKIVALTLDDGGVCLRGPRIDLSLARYDGLAGLGTELAALVRSILETVVNQ